MCKLIPKTVRFVTVRSERVAEEVEALLPSILQRGLGLVDGQPEPRHRHFCSCQSLSRTSAAEDDEVIGHPSESPDFSRVSMPPGFPDALRRTGRRFLKEYHSQMRPFENEYEVAPGVLVHRTGGHTPGHSVVRLASGGNRLTFAGDAVFQVGFEHPDWYNGFEHDPEEAARVRVGLLRELAANRELLVATHLSFPSVCRVAIDGDVFRWVPGPWEY